VDGGDPIASHRHRQWWWPGDEGRSPDRVSNRSHTPMRVCARQRSVQEAHISCWFDHRQALSLSLSLSLSCLLTDRSTNIASTRPLLSVSSSLFIVALPYHRHRQTLAPLPLASLLPHRHYVIISIILLPANVHEIHSHSHSHTCHELVIDSPSRERRQYSIIYLARFIGGITNSSAHAMAV